jgi:hypothetical protein
MSSPRTLTIFSINGYMGDMWSGPQAEVAQHLSNQGTNLAYWQPIGYQAGAFPLSTGVASGLAEVRRQRQLHPGPFLVSAWSEGAIIMTEWLRNDPAALHDCKGGVTYGNPYRAAGQWNPTGSAIGSVPDPGGAGIGGPRNNWRTPDSIHHYVHGFNQPSYDGIGGVDMYTACRTDEVGSVERIIFDFVLTQWGGSVMDLWSFGEHLITNAIGEAWAVTQAIIQAISFYGGQCRPHTDYTSYAGASYLANLAHSLP